MRKIEMRICKCGRIHFYSTELLNKLLEEDKELVLICSSCGNVLHIGADKESACFYDEDADENGICYNMYSWEEKSGEITMERFMPDVMKEQHKRVIGKIIVDEGIPVMMKTGYYARSYLDGVFYDDWYPDFYKIQRKDITVEEILTFIKEWEDNRKKVMMNALLNSLTDEQAEVLSSYWIEGLDWTGTRWEKEWNSRK